MVVFYSSIVGQPRVGISYSKQYGYILEQIRTIQYEFDMVVSQNVICSVCNIFHIGTHYKLLPVHVVFKLLTIW